CHICGASARPRENSLFHLYPGLLSPRRWTTSALSALPQEKGWRSAAGGSGISLKTGHGRPEKRLERRRRLFHAPPQSGAGAGAARKKGAAQNPLETPGSVSYI